MKIILFGIWMTCSADAVTTHIGLNQGAREVVMPSQNPFILDSIGVSEAAVSSLGIVWLNKHKHPKAARILGWSIIAARGFVVYHNINELRK
jgi:hypothetical protein